MGEKSVLSFFGSIDATSGVATGTKANRSPYRERTASCIDQGQGPLDTIRVLSWRVVIGLDFFRVCEVSEISNEEARMPSSGPRLMCRVPWYVCSNR